MPGRKISHTPLDPKERIGWQRPSQSLKSPTTLTRCALGAHTAKLVPATPSTARNCEPSFSYRRRSSPLPKRYRSESPSVGRNEYGSRTLRDEPDLALIHS